MWDTYELPPSGNFSLRKIAFAFFTVIVTALLWILLYSAPVFAANATWNNGVLTYNGNQYSSEANSVPDVPAGSTLYSYKPNTNGNQSTASVIYFPSTADITKPIKNATIRNYTVAADGTLTASDQGTSIDVDAKPPDKKEKTSCDVVGVGWLMCPISRSLAKGMDNVFRWVSGFLEVKPITNDTNSGIYKAWDVARGLANLCFILAFLIIIYSQLTQQGINNYEIKKMIPKLIIASILVNISYYVCSIGVDLSNILGHSVQQALVDIRNMMPKPPMQNWLSFQNVTEYVLSGGTIGGAAIAGWAAVAGGAAGSITAMVALLLPILVAGAFSVIVALLILAARQALITVLIVISPLAFVAFLLPNTEKWFERWRELFTTMLIMFPLFSLLFGGSQLAAAIILQSASQFSVVLFALFIQVAPLIMTPFIVKFSGSLLGRLAGMVNDPKKGIIDGTRNWAQDRADLRKKSALSHGANQKFGLRRMAYNREMGRRKREGLKGVYEAETDARWHNDKRYHAIHSRNKAAELMKHVGESSGDAEFEADKVKNPTLNRYVGQQRANQDYTAMMQKREEARWEEAKSKDMSGDNRFREYAGDARSALLDSRIAQDNLTIAQSLQKSEYSTAVEASDVLQRQAGGIGGELGAIKVKAAGMSEVINSGNEAVKAIRTASSIKPGDVTSMRQAFDNAVREKDIASMRAHADMLADASNAGMDGLRQAIKSNESSIRGLSESALDTFRHHINSNSTINAGAEDIAVWSRDAGDNWRTLQVIGDAGKTWKNLTAIQIATSKASTQDLALDARKDDGTYALTKEMAEDIVGSQAWINIKDEQKQKFRTRAGVDRLDIRRGRN